LEQTPVADQPLRILIIGAHPDDADIKAGGTAARWADLGHVVKLVSLTDGGAGHHLAPGPPLVARRREEARAAAAVIGATYEVMDIPDGRLDDRLEYRERVIALIRAFRPDLVLTHRAFDYHPDHRFAGLLVQDASYMVTVPAVCPGVPHLAHSPVVMTFSDAFRRPCPFEPHVVVDIDDQFDRVVAMLHRHASQFYEWLPANAGHADAVPAGDEARLDWLASRFAERIRPLADRHRDLVVATYGPGRGRAIRYVEAFEVSEYGAPLDAAARARLFPFVPTTPAITSPNARKVWVDQPEDASD
jgi:LmbE family N-acetylglucosaminyl deacetylase